MRKDVSKLAAIHFHKEGLSRCTIVDDSENGAVYADVWETHFLALMALNETLEGVSRDIRAGEDNAANQQIYFFVSNRDAA
jgi:hypothetical protein